MDLLPWALEIALESQGLIRREMVDLARRLGMDPRKVPFAVKAARMATLDMVMPVLLPFPNLEALLPLAIFKSGQTGPDPLDCLPSDLMLQHASMMEQFDPLSTIERALDGTLAEHLAIPGRPCCRWSAGPRGPSWSCRWRRGPPRLR